MNLFSLFKKAGLKQYQVVISQVESTRHIFPSLNKQTLIQLNYIEFFVFLSVTQTQPEKDQTPAIAMKYIDAPTEAQNSLKRRNQAKIADLTGNYLVTI